MHIFNYPPSNIAPKEKSFVEYLLIKNYIKEDQKQILLFEQRQTCKRLTQLICELGFMSEESVLIAYADYSHIEIYNKNYHLDQNIINQFPMTDARRFHILPLFIKKNYLYAGMVDPEDITACDRLHCFFSPSLIIKPVLIQETVFIQLLNEAYGMGGETGSLSNLPAIASSEFSPLTFGEELIEQAVKRGASDIHLEPDKNVTVIRLRVDGLLQSFYRIHPLNWPALSVRLKIMAGMNIAESRLPQDGRFSLKIEGRSIDFRVATHPTLYGENIVIRILDKQHSLRDLDYLGFDKKQTELLKYFVRQPEGMIILTGPTGSGKTTTLYSLLHYMNAENLNIMTLEEPIEYEIQGIRQTEVKDIGGVSFAEGTRSILRQDPDIILIGEIRDAETAQMAVRAAMTGHLVLTTLHTNDCFSVISRLLDFGLSPDLLAGNLLTIVSQRLIRKLCTHCSPEPTSSLSCEYCYGQRYRGRIAVGEVLSIDEELEVMIATHQPIPHLKRHANQTGFIDLRRQADHLLIQGITDTAEIQRVIRG